MDEVHLEINPVKAGSDAPKICVEAAKVSPAFRADIHVSVIEWTSKHKADSACAKEWQRVRALIRAHENKHVSDIDESVRDANARVFKLLPIRKCAATIEDARKQAARDVATMLTKEVGTLQTALDEKAAGRDVENAYMDCKPCNDKISFKGVTLDCVVKTPACTVRMEQKLEGQVCGDPVTTLWKISPKYFTEGCGAPPSNGKTDKPFTNDCVEAGADTEKRRAETYRKFRSTGAGGWMCVYSASPKPTITIRNFRSSVCQGAAEQTLTVDAEASEGCDEPSQPPPGTPPAKPLPVS